MPLADSRAATDHPAPAVVTRHQGPILAAGLVTPFRRTALERLDRPDGSVLLRWPDDVCSLNAGSASPGADTRCVVGNVTDWLPVWSQHRPDQMFLAERGPDGQWSTLSYRDGMRRIIAIGAQLLARYGADPGMQPAPMAILTPNSLRQALLTYAALYVGLPVAPISPAYCSPGGDYARLRAVFSKLEPGWVYSESSAAAMPALAALNHPLDTLITAADIDDWTGNPSPSDSAAVERAHRQARGERIGKIMFTSGSTGSPKGVVMTHAMLASAQATSAAALERLPDTQQVYLEWLPWHHVMGGNINMHRILRLGASAFLDNGRPVAGKFSETIANLREISPSFYFNVPLGYAMLVPELERDEELARRFFARLEYLSFGGAALPGDIVARLDRLAGLHAGRRIPVIAGFGATESSGPALGTAWNMDSAGAVGLPSPGITLKLVPLGDRYEMRLAGNNMARAYLKEPELTSAAFDEEGFYRIGDAVKWADDSDPMQGLRFAGRVSEDFKLTSGTWVNAGALRLRFLAAFTPLIRDAVITGHDRAYIAAMGFIDERACRELAGVDPALPVADLVAHPALLHGLAERLRRLNRDVHGSSQRIERVRLLAEPAQADALEITDKGYINQRAVIQRRAALVDAMYADPPGSGVVSGAAEGAK